jgi:hypothetical protein
VGRLRRLIAQSGRNATSQGLSPFELGIALTIATLTGLVPGLTDASGRIFSLFKLNAYQHLLHAVSDFWALSAASLRVFGTCTFWTG